MTKSQKLLERIIHNNKNYTLFEFGNFNGRKIPSFFSVKKDRPKILFTAGIHGDEPAGIHALKKTILQIKPPENYSIAILPLLNPYGYDHNTRHNEQDRDLNRAFNKSLKNDSTDVLEKFILKFNPDLAVNLHEDGVHNGCYLYIAQEDLMEEAEDIISIIKKILPIDSSKEIFKDENNQGIILQDHDDNRPKNKQTLENFQYENGIPYITFETSKKHPLKDRLKAQLAVIRYFLE